MLRFAFIIAVLSLSACKSNDTDAELADSLACPVEPAADSCQLYKCVETEAQCGDEGYPLAYGERYCRRFLNLCDETLFTADEKKWVAATAVCLQEATAEAQVLDGACDALTTKSFEAHSRCYTEGAQENGGPSFCALGPASWRRIRACVVRDDRLSLKGLRQLSKVVLKCSSQLVGGLFLDSPDAPDESMQQDWAKEAAELGQQWAKEAEGS